MVELHLVHPEDRLIPMQRCPRGYHRVIAEAGPGARYFYRLPGGHDRPDPASRYQPSTVHGPSEVTSQEFPWNDAGWRGLPLDDYVFYELHIGAFSPEGTFDGAVAKLDTLVELGITALELMPVAQFPGSRNWGYDGVFPFAVQNSYGGPDGLKRLIAACHERGLAAVLDVVYNHLGPEGNYLREFGPYFNQEYRTPWGSALNFDGPGSDEVRRFFLDNALYWLTEFHFDALRLDAVHAICDRSAFPFLQELSETVRAASGRLGRRTYTIVESDLNDARLVLPAAAGGCGLSAQWSDDFHHALHTLLTGEAGGYYRDFGRLEHLVQAMRAGSVYTGQYSEARRRRHGNSPRNLEGRQLVVFAQNHDQAGNRMRGERLCSLVPFEAQKLAAGLVLLSPFLPLLFMGEEYGETAPFLYFVDHSDPALIEAVRRGRREEFANFSWGEEPPDPQSEATFLRSKLNAELLGREDHRVLWEFYREMLRLRRSVPALASLDKDQQEVAALERHRLVAMRRWKDEHQVFAAFHLGKEQARIPVPLPAGRWQKTLYSGETHWRAEAAQSAGAGGQGETVSRQADPAPEIPGVIESNGEAALDLGPTSFVLFSRQEA